jgi:uncharacterized protein
MPSIKKNSAKSPFLPAWREVVRRKMYAAALKEGRKRSKQKTPPFMYRWEHVCAVVNVGARLAALTGADAEVVEAAAWLHDIAKEAGARHPDLGAKAARRILPKTDFPAEKIEAVAQAIELHMGLWRTQLLPTLEARVLWDADKLTKIGLTAALHWMGGDIASGGSHSTMRLLNRLRSADWRSRTVDSMQTEPGREAARLRLAAYDRFCRELSAEWLGDDLALLPEAKAEPERKSAAPPPLPSRHPHPLRLARDMSDDD